MTEFSKQVSSLIAYFGEAITLRKITLGDFNATTLQTPSTATDYQIKASVRFYKPNEIAGLIQQGDRMVKIASDDISVTPTPHDKVIIGGKLFNIVSVNARSTQGATATYIMQVRG